MDKCGNSNVISWQSKKVKRVCNSTLSAECLAAVECANAAIYLRELIVELGSWKSNRIHVLTGNKSLVQAVESVSPVDDKRLRIDIAILQETVVTETVESIAYMFLLPKIWQMH